MATYMIATPWKLAKIDSPKRFDSLSRGDFVHVRIASGQHSEDLWVKVIGPTNKRDEYWAALDDTPALITDMPLHYQVAFNPCHVIDFIAHETDRLEMIELWGDAWGSYKRIDESDFPIQTSMTQIQNKGDLGVLGDGCFRGNTALKQFNNGISYRERIKQQSRFERAWKLVSKRSQLVLWVHYVADETLTKKLDALEITAHEYFPTLRKAEEEIWSIIKRSDDG